MTVERYLRGIAGFFILLSLALAQWHSHYWYVFTAFVGVNLLQSSFTNWCPMMTFLNRLFRVPCECAKTAVDSR